MTWVNLNFMAWLVWVVLLGWCEWCCFIRDLTATQCHIDEASNCTWAIYSSVTLQFSFICFTWNSSSSLDSSTALSTLMCLSTQQRVKITDFSASTPKLKPVCNTTNCMLLTEVESYRRHLSIIEGWIHQSGIPSSCFPFLKVQFQWSWISNFNLKFNV